jgi:hypothetical protein
MKNSRKQWVMFAALFVFSVACYAFLSTRSNDNQGFVTKLNLEKLEKPEKPGDLDGEKYRHNFLLHVEMLKKLAAGARKFLPASNY